MSTTATPAVLAETAHDEIERLRKLAATVAATIDPVAALGVRRAITELEALTDLLAEVGQ